jgi:hypothetical protein
MEEALSSKDQAAVWALPHAEDPSLLQSALAIRRTTALEGSTPPRYAPSRWASKRASLRCLVDLLLQHMPHLRCCEEARTKRRLVDPAGK